MLLKHPPLQVLNVMKMGGNTLVELAVNRNLLDPDGFPYASSLAGECCPLFFSLVDQIYMCLHELFRQPRLLSF